jgi:hypothetical protein
MSRTLLAGNVVSVVGIPDTGISDTSISNTSSPIVDVDVAFSCY